MDDAVQKKNIDKYDSSRNVKSPAWMHKESALWKIVS